MVVDYIDMQVSRKEITEWLPDYDNRRAIVARDALASVEGFRMAILLVCEYVLGVRVCPLCPNCSYKKYDDGETNENMDNYPHTKMKEELVMNKFMEDVQF